MNLLYIIYYPKSDATKPSQCHPSVQTLEWLCCITTYERPTIQATY
ncbi:MAG: hypothetical protein ACR5LA_08235 [Wolbachia sp.]